MGCNCGRAVTQAKKLASGRRIGKAVIIPPAAKKFAAAGKRIGTKKVAAKKVAAKKVAPCTGCGKK